MSTRKLAMVGALVAAIAAAAGTSAQAQAPANGQPGMRRPGGPGGGMGPLGDIGLPLPALNLRDEQKAQVQAVIEAHRAELEQLAQRIGPAHQAVRQAIETVPVDETLIRAKSAELAAAEADGAVLRARVRSEIWALLTAEQQQQASQLRMRRPGPRGGAPMRRQGRR
jgi:Spy/CpxP family protein refolding chaperone